MTDSTASSTTPARPPLHIKMDERDNVAIVANDGGCLRARCSPRA